MANYRSVLSGEYEAKLAVHETLLPAYQAALEQAQCGLEFEIKDGKISLYGEQDTDLCLDLFNSLEAALTPYANDDILELARKLRTGDVGPSDELFFQGILEFHGESDELCPAFALLVACGLEEHLRLEQVGHEKCNYVTYSDDKLVPIEDYLNKEPAPLQSGLKYPIEQHPVLLRSDLQIVMSLWNKYRVTHSTEFAEEVKAHMNSLLFNVGWMLNHITENNLERLKNDYEHWSVLHKALNYINVILEVTIRDQEKWMELKIDRLFSATEDRDKILGCLWDEFDTPIDEDEHIDDDFLHFPKGTHREIVWKWFDEHHSKGVAWLMGQA